MANAIKKISVQRGYDVTDYVLNSFGGAGGQHACLVADALGMEAVLIHPFSGLLSAYGMGLAASSRRASRRSLKPLAEEALTAIDELIDEARARPSAELAARASRRTTSRCGRAAIRYDGTDTTLAGALSAARSLDGRAQTSRRAHKAQFGFVYEASRWSSRRSGRGQSTAARAAATRPNTARASTQACRDAANLLRRRLARRRRSSAARRSGPATSSTARR